MSGMSKSTLEHQVEWKEEGPGVSTVGVPPALSPLRLVQTEARKTGVLKESTLPLDTESIRWEKRGSYVNIYHDRLRRKGY